MKLTHRKLFPHEALVALRILILSIGFLFPQSAAHANKNCTQELGRLQPHSNSDIQWRQNFSHPLSDGSFVRTTPAREQQIKTARENMIKEISGSFDGHSDTPPIIVIPEEGTVIQLLKPWQEYQPMEAKVTGAPDGFLRATILLPVSGHTGLSNAQQWAKTDTYVLKLSQSKSEAVLVPTSRSLDLVTAHDVIIPLTQGTTTRLLYYRSGSGGPGGYSGGRDLGIIWDSSQPTHPGIDYSKPFWR